MSKIGLLVGRERFFPNAVIAYINARSGPVAAEYVTVGGARMAEPPEYAVILDRISHAYPFYQSYLKNAALQGAQVINDPFWQRANDVFLSAGVAERLGVRMARTLLLPNRDHIEGVVPESLRNRADPLDWEGAVRTLGFPMVMRSNRPERAHDARLLRSPEELFAMWDASGTAQYLLQEVVLAERYVRCLVVGDDVLPVPWSPPPGYDVEDRIAGGQAVFDAAAARAAEAARRLSNALGQRINAVDFALGDGEPVALVLSHPAPELDPQRLRYQGFAWSVERTADLLVRLAEQAPSARYRWDPLLRTD